MSLGPSDPRTDAHAAATAATAAAGWGEPAANDALRAARLAQAKRLATGVLAGCALLFIVARVLQPEFPAFGYLAAFAEAAIIGALADWYAVVVLFRHPLGIRLPHTAIIPANQDRIADNLGEFIETHLLAPGPIAERLGQMRFAEGAGAWLADPGRSRELLDAAVRELPQIVHALESAGLRELLVRGALTRLEKIDLSPAAAAVLETLVREGRHQQLLDAILVGLHRLLRNTELVDVLRDKIRAQLPAVFNMFQADSYVLRKLLATTATLLGEAQRNPDHPIRREFDHFVHEFIEHLRSSPEHREKLDAIKRELLARPELRAFALDLWRRFDAWLAQDVAAEPSLVRTHAAEIFVGIGRHLQAEPELCARIDRTIVATVLPLVERHKRGFARFVTEQVKSWDKRSLTQLIELNIGTDLQYIRINGAVVGGLIGMLIHAVTQLTGL